MLDGGINYLRKTAVDDVIFYVQASDDCRAVVASITVTDRAGLAGIGQTNIEVARTDIE
jgi:hypothetical protein